MLRQILIQVESHDDSKSLFRLSIDALLVAKGVTVGQACYLVSEVLGRIGAHDAETSTLDPNDDVEMLNETEAELETAQVDAWSLLKGANPG